jgi:enamine deaminase RidA (YjgF/YER057c/UK114 family)
MTKDTLATNDAEHRLQELGITLPRAPKPFGPYVPAVQTGNLLYLSGMLPTVGHEAEVRGRLGDQLDVDAGRAAARTAALNALAVAKEHLASLDCVTRVVRLALYIATVDGFTEHPKVADAASELFRDVFGAEKISTRLVFEIATLPLGVPVELEVILEVNA